MFINELPSLKNIINLFNIFKTFSSAEKNDLELTIGELMDNYVENTPLSFSSPHFHQQIKEGKSITVTDPTMTRFMMTLQDAVDLVLFAFQNGKQGDIFVQKSPSTTIGELAKTMKKIYSSSIEIKNIGIRHAEKIHETLLSSEERMDAEDMGNYFRVSADNRDLNYKKFFSEGNKGNFQLEEYNSDNTNRLSEQQLINLLASIGYQ